jgi:hypothetical protein
MKEYGSDNTNPKEHRQYATPNNLDSLVSSTTSQGRSHPTLFSSNQGFKPQMLRPFLYFATEKKN